MRLHPRPFLRALSYSTGNYAGLYHEVPFGYTPRMARNLNEAGESARFVYLIELAGKQQILIMKLHSEGKIIGARDHMFSSTGLVI